VARDRRRGDLERGREVADRGFAVGKTFQDASADRIGERRKDSVEGTGSILNHKVKY
jgi:hypothetical protein